jgi:hypothetical protein
MVCTLRSTSRVAKVWRRSYGLKPTIPARSHADEKPFLFDLIGWPFSPRSYLPLRDNHTVFADVAPKSSILFLSHNCWCRQQFTLRRRRINIGRRVLGDASANQSQNGLMPLFSDPLWETADNTPSGINQCLCLRSGKTSCIPQIIHLIDEGLQQIARGCEIPSVHSLAR